jgi:hypothetical protein
MAILEILVRHRGALVTQRRLLTEVWGPNYRTQTNYLRVYLANSARNSNPNRRASATSSPSPAWATDSNRQPARHQGPLVGGVGRVKDLGRVAWTHSLEIERTMFKIIDTPQR